MHPKKNRKFPFVSNQIITIDDFTIFAVRAGVDDFNKGARNPQMAIYKKMSDFLPKLFFRILHKNMSASPFSQHALRIAPPEILQFTRDIEETEEEYIERVCGGVGELNRYVRDVVDARQLPPFIADYGVLLRRDGEDESDWEDRVAEEYERVYTEATSVAGEFEKVQYGMDVAVERCKALATHIPHRILHTSLQHPNTDINQFFKQECASVLEEYEELSRADTAVIPEEYEDDVHLPLKEREVRRHLRLSYNKGVTRSTRNTNDVLVKNYLALESITLHNNSQRVYRSPYESEEEYIHRVKDVVYNAVYEVLVGYHAHRADALLEWVLDNKISWCNDIVKVKKELLPAAHGGAFLSFLDRRGLTLKTSQFKGGVARTGDGSPVGFATMSAHIAGRLKSPTRNGTASPTSSTSSASPARNVQSLYDKRHDELVERSQVVHVPLDSKSANFDWVDGALIAEGRGANAENRMDFWMQEARRMIAGEPQRSVSGDLQNAPRSHTVNPVHPSLLCGAAEAFLFKHNLQQLFRTEQLIESFVEANPLEPLTFTPPRGDPKAAAFIRSEVQKRADTVLANFDVFLQKYCIVTPHHDGKEINHIPQNAPPPPAAGIPWEDADETDTAIPLPIDAHRSTEVASFIENLGLKEVAKKHMTVVQDQPPPPPPISPVRQSNALSEMLPNVDVGVQRMTKSLSHSPRGVSPAEAEVFSKMPTPGSREWGSGGSYRFGTLASRASDANPVWDHQHSTVHLVQPEPDHDPTPPEHVEDHVNYDRSFARHKVTCEAGEGVQQRRHSPARSISPPRRASPLHECRVLNGEDEVGAAQNFLGKYSSRSYYYNVASPLHGGLPWEKRGPGDAVQMNVAMESQPSSLEVILRSATQPQAGLALLVNAQRLLAMGGRGGGTLSPRQMRLMCDTKCGNSAVFLCMDCQGASYCPNCWERHHEGVRNGGTKKAHHRKLVAPYVCFLCDAQAKVECRACQVMCCPSCWDTCHEGLEGHEALSLDTGAYHGRPEPKEMSPPRPEGGGDVTSLWISRNPSTVRRAQSQVERREKSLFTARAGLMKGASRMEVERRSPIFPQARGDVEGGLSPYALSPPRVQHLKQSVPSPTHVSRLLQIYKQKAPQKIHLVHSDLKRYKGREEELYVELEEQYGPLPALEEYHGGFLGSAA